MLHGPIIPIRLKVYATLCLTQQSHIISILGMRTCIFCLAPASQCVNSPTEAARARALLTAHEARLPTNDGS